MTVMINEPTPDYILSRLPDFDATPRYSDADRAVGLVFSQWPTNRLIEEVLAKVVTLNTLYSTNIYGVYDVARHIVELNIDGRLTNGDQSLVDDIANVAIGRRTRQVLSFASKYCSWHRPECYQIYDSFVDELLWVYQREFAFATFKRVELRTYSRFIQIVDALVDHFGLQVFSRKDLDKFLWLEGRAISRSSVRRPR